MLPLYYYYFMANEKPMPLATFSAIFVTVGAVVGAGTFSLVLTVSRYSPWYRLRRRHPAAVLTVVVPFVYGGLLYLTYWTFGKVPTSFIPAQDQGWLMVNIQLPDSASLQRTKEVMAQAEQIALKTPGVAHTLSTSGYSLLLNVFGSNYASMFVILDPFRANVEQGEDQQGNATSITRSCARSTKQIQAAASAVFEGSAGQRPGHRRRLRSRWWRMAIWGSPFRSRQNRQAD